MSKAGESLIRGACEALAAHPDRTWSIGLAKRLKTDRRVDIIAQYCLSRLDITRKQAFGTLLEQGLAKRGVALNTGLDRLFEVSC